MEQTAKSFLEAFDEKKNLGTLKTLTVLTFIGCGLEFLISLFSFTFFAKYSFNMADRFLNQGNPDNLPSSVGKAYTPDVFETLSRTYQYKLPIFIFSLLGITLCILGAVKMRKLKSDGYWIWLIGEIIPYFSFIFFVGPGSFAKPTSFLILIIPITFIILYTIQKKKLS